MSIFVRYPVEKPGQREAAAGLGRPAAGNERRAGEAALARRWTTERSLALLAGGSSALIEGLGYVRLEVTDLERSIAFYRDGLRFVYDGRGDGDSRQAMLHAGDLRLVLREAKARGNSKRGAGIRLSVEVTGVDAYHDALVARGLAPSRPLDEGQSRHFDISDPDGYRWAFVQSLG